MLTRGAGVSRTRRSRFLWVSSQKWSCGIAWYFSSSLFRGVSALWLAAAMPLYRFTSSAQDSLLPTWPPAFMSCLSDLSRSNEHASFDSILLLLRDGESLLYLLTICISDLEKCLFRSLAHVNWINGMLLWSWTVLCLFKTIGDIQTSGG